MKEWAPTPQHRTSKQALFPARPSRNRDASMKRLLEKVAKIAKGAKTAKTKERPAESHHTQEFAEIFGFRAPRGGCELFIPSIAPRRK